MPLNTPLLLVNAGGKPVINPGWHLAYGWHKTLYGVAKLLSAIGQVVCRIESVSAIRYLRKEQVIGSLFKSLISRMNR
jgi:hypothetical protein